MKSYRDAITFLFGLRRFGIRPGLHTIKQLLHSLGNPERGLRFVHIAGTNGKGSTAAFLHSILMHSGCTPGLYTSPHLSDFCERIRTGSAEIDRDMVVELACRIRRMCDYNQLGPCTFFEYATAMALLHFNRTGADPVIMETGMGGRYDATNCIQPLVSIITSIGLDHQEYLGDTISAIAAEKAGIVKPGAPLVSAGEPEDAVRIFDAACRGAGVAHYRRGRDFHFRGTATYAGLRHTIEDMRIGLRGLYQAGNAALAAAAAEELMQKGYAIPESAIRDGIARTRWPGRFDCVSTSPMIILDGAHNAPAWECLADSIRRLHPDKNLITVAGIMRDKDIGAFMHCFVPMSRTMILCRPEVERAADSHIFSKYIRFSDENRIFWEPAPRAALRRAMALSAPDDMILVTGSLYLAGELYSEFFPDAAPESSGTIAL